MNARALFLVSIIFLFVSNSSFAQDQIHKKTGDTIFCHVQEVGDEVLKYYLPDFPESTLFTIDKEKVNKLVFSTGQELTFEPEMTNPENYIDNRKRAIKIDFISPLTGNTTFSYEQSIRPGRSLEGSVGLIGLGLDPGNRNAIGAFVQFGMKFIKSPDFYFSKMRYSHLLKGGYVKPEVSIGAYGADIDDYYSNQKRETVFTAAIMINIGKQWVFDNVMLLDLYFGVGYGFSTGYYNEDLDYNFGYFTGPPQFPIAFTGGINIGYLLK